ncbi:hypothetical protein LSH36_582g02003 [Paralvinella palmiformis]|uniref:Uncharacterized protein n=1 Tax=Paralvinella palmiformis TaxID=53620 RepID=A0AAD9MXR2_9ANNE|nr:hypothetical protein LSH36_582g02003 [Paralvinella palmiformis]
MVAWLTATEANDKLLTSIEPDVLDRYSHFLYGPDDDKTKGQCPAYGATCYKCSGKNHHASTCRSTKPRSTHELDTTTQVDDDFLVHSTCMIGTMSKDSAWYANLRVRAYAVKFNVDTGAETNTVPMNVWKRIPSKPTLMWSNVVLSVFRGGTVQHQGVARVPKYVI